MRVCAHRAGTISEMPKYVTPTSSTIDCQSGGIAGDVRRFGEGDVRVFCNTRSAVMPSRAAAPLPPPCVGAASSERALRGAGAISRCRRGLPRAETELPKKTLCRGWIGAPPPQFRQCGVVISDRSRFVNC